jgi:hypothetical protein
MSNKLVKPQSNDIIIDDGLKTYYIKNKQGHVYGKFDFRPSDTNLISRYDEVVEHLNSFSTPENEPADIKKVENMVADELSYLIGSDSKESFFSILGPFSPLASGKLFFEEVVDAIGRVIETETEHRAKKVRTRMNKYVTKYRK